MDPRERKYDLGIAVFRPAKFQLPTTQQPIFEAVVELRNFVSFKDLIPLNYTTYKGKDGISFIKRSETKNKTGFVIVSKFVPCKKKHHGFSLSPKQLHHKLKTSSTICWKVPF